ncbi:unnamed protein product [Cylindrotheca closterium]|uniref:Uncharacterized protein n=1 Tax=Cylindrotheca closterium TaxID=2856 RepID=A0AAD2FX47_9STRA|nr:unnamed protein product [Cylindrotheca closterium]
MYNYKIQKDHNGVLRLGKFHGNINWKHATKVEMDLLATYKVLVDMGRGTPMPKDHQKFQVQLVNALKHCDKHKPRFLPYGGFTYIVPHQIKSHCQTDQSAKGIM